MLVAYAIILFPKADPLFNTTLKFHTSPLKIGPKGLADLPAIGSPVLPEAITKWANDPLPNLEVSRLWDIPTEKSKGPFKKPFVPSPKVIIS